MAEAHQPGSWPGRAMTKMSSLGDRQQNLELAPLTRSAAHTIKINPV